MNLGQILRSALLTLRTQKLRTALTLFGMVWGTASVVFLLSWGLGLERMINDGFNKIGKNTVQIWPGKVGEDYTPALDRRELWFSLEDVEALRAGVKQADLVLPESRGWYRVTHGEELLSRDVRGVVPEHQELRGTRLSAGRMITADDVRSRRRVAVLGAGSRRDLLGPGARLGQRIRVMGTPHEVVGFFEGVGTQLSRDSSEIDEQVWVPLTTFLAQRGGFIGNEEVIDMILLRARSRDVFEELKREVRPILTRRLGVRFDDQEAYMVYSPIENLRDMPLGRMQGMLFVLAATTLGIGGVGILNMMLDSVQERRQEIGVRLAVGARRRDVVAQFFLETLVITAVGGSLGLSVGLGLCFVLAQMQVPDLIPLPIVQPWIVWIALGTMSLVGVLSGIVPAWRASGVDPSVTLRAE